ncbi:transglutaminase-like cysteine peptidase [Aquamicrobium sp.]|uniref:transglutaminase-like cysteine peptidase n=1 Tax=Aquamicrobium sp. TaxID=1872579 RepID=UPI00258B1588|nr:transglutaminase-like cysteine peptidase [Aquamicrobium sp.]MCK9551180.1 transglutaminase-like cysteine peptidase [Aquamicrobium sp.]
MTFNWGASLVTAMTMLIATLGSAHAGNSFMPTGGRTTQPVGHYEFCQGLPQECRQKTAKKAPVDLTRKLWATIISVNNDVNTSVIPMTDMEIWGREEVWSYPVNGMGDCEDYVLEKRRRLMQAGVPAGNLLITVVRQPNGEGHAVLTVHTSMGDFILDNLESRVLAWSQTQYTYLKRQSAQNSGVWVSITDGRADAVASVR